MGVRVLSRARWALYSMSGIVFYTVNILYHSDRVVISSIFARWHLYMCVASECAIQKIVAASRPINTFTSLFFFTLYILYVVLLGYGWSRLSEVFVMSIKAASLKSADNLLKSIYLHLQTSWSSISGVTIWSWLPVPKNPRHWDLLTLCFVKK